MSDSIRERVVSALTGQYTVDAEIGRGGMSVVYRAFDTRLQRHVAIKVLPPEFAFDPAVRERFRREAQTAAQLNHPNIVPIFAVDERDGISFFAMALCDGESLAARLSRVARPPLAEVRRILVEVSDALAYAHARGVIHRDVKPDNILIEPETGRAMVTDFGIARAAEAGTRLTHTGVAVGTPTYMSPEQALGEEEIDGRSDIYSLGVVAYQMLTGTPPFVAKNTPAMLMKHVTEAPVPVGERRSDAPADLVLAAERALAKDPGDRWENAGMLRDHLTGAKTDERPLGSRHYVARRDPRPKTQDPRAEGGDQSGTVTPLPERESFSLSPRGVLTPAELDFQISVRARIQKLRHRLGVYPGFAAVALTVNIVQMSMPGRGPGAWFLVPVAIMAADIIRRFGSLWADGISFQDVLRYRPWHEAPGADRAGLGAPESQLTRRALRRREREERRLTREAPAPPSSRALVPSPPQMVEESRLADGPPADALASRPAGKLWWYALNGMQRLKLAVVSSAGLSAGLLLASTMESDFMPMFGLSLIVTGGLFARLSWLRRREHGRERAMWLRAGADAARLGQGKGGTESPALARRREMLLREGLSAELLYGPHGGVIVSAAEDRDAILALVAELPAADRQQLPDVGPTVKGLFDRVRSLAPMLHGIDSSASPETLAALDARIAQMEPQRGSSADAERTLGLLERQRRSLADLVERRKVLIAQLESASLLLQTLRLDVMKMRSSGIGAAMNDVLNATQEARALSKEIGYVLGAAAEVR